MSQRFYEEEEAHEILRRAARSNPTASSASGITRANLEQTAAELGIPVEALDEAERQVRIERNRRSLHAEFLAERKREFTPHLAAYVIVNTFLILIDLLGGGGIWFHWPLLGWGIGMAFHTWSTFGPESSIDGPVFIRWVEKRRKREKKLREKQRRTFDDDDDDDD